MSTPRLSLGRLTIADSDLIVGADPGGLIDIHHDDNGMPLCGLDRTDRMHLVALLLSTLEAGLPLAREIRAAQDEATS